MTLTLLALSLNEQPLSQPLSAVFDARGGTIGRADHNTMALPDPQRHVSRLQAEVLVQGSDYAVRNVGAANAIIVGGRTLAPGETAPLAQADLIRIGGYLLSVRIAEAAPPKRPVTPPAQAWAAAAPTAPAAVPTPSGRLRRSARRRQPGQGTGGQPLRGPARRRCGGGFREGTRSVPRLVER